MKNAGNKLGNNNLGVVLLKDYNGDTRTLIENLEISDLESVCLLTNTRFKVNSDSNKIKTVCLNEQRLNYLLNTNGNLDLNSIKKLSDIIRESKCNHIVIEEGENLCPLPFDKNENLKKRDTLYANLLSGLKSVCIALNSENAVLFSIIILTRSDTMYKALLPIVEKTAGVNSFTAEISVKNRKNDIGIGQNTNNIDTLLDAFSNSETTTRLPSTGVKRIDEVIRNNKASYGDTIFYSSSDNSMAIRYAQYAVIPSAPFTEEILFISPFVSSRELGESLKRINDSYKKITARAIKRTQVITSESFRGVDLNDKDVLMGAIRKHISVFRRNLDDIGHIEGICIIDCTGIDHFGAEIDYPSVRWYAKTNNILIIIGADSAEERYTYTRNAQLSTQKETHSTPKLEKDKKTPKLEAPTTKPTEKKI